MPSMIEYMERDLPDDKRNRLMSQWKEATAYISDDCCKHRWRRVIPLPREQCSICKVFKHELPKTDTRFCIAITCGCGQRRAIELMYRCLECGEWYCEHCATIHFGTKPLA